MIKRSVVFLAMLTLAGGALAQAPSPPAPPQWHGHHRGRDSARWRQTMQQRRMERLTLLLDLTPAQQRQVEAIFTDEHTRMKAAMRQVRQAMQQARATHETVRKETQQRLKSVLNPLQMKKLAALMPGPGMMHDMMMHRMMMGGMGPGMMGPGKMGPPPAPPAPGPR